MCHHSSCSVADLNRTDLQGLKTDFICLNCLGKMSVFLWIHLKKQVLELLKSLVSFYLY